MDRRTFLHAALAATGAGPLLAQDAPRALPPKRPTPPTKKLALVTTAYHYLSHAYHLAGRFLYGYLREGKMHYPDWGLAGMFVEQRTRKEGPTRDLSAEVSKAHGVPVFDSVAEALTLGGDTLAVDGVLLVGEHGDYPYNEKGQKLYPRYELFQKVVEVFRKAKRSVPVFCDKHLSHDHKQAVAMVATAKELKFPFMAGSSLPITWRRPEFDLEVGTPVREALVASRGEIEIYGFHALEALQCVVERRLKGQQGVAAVECLDGDAVWKAGDAGVWSWPLLEAALARSPSRNVGDVRENCRQFEPPTGRPTFPRGPVAFVVEYRDGLKATALLLNGHVDDTTIALRTKEGEKPVGGMFYLPPPPGAAFLEALVLKVEQFLTTGVPPMPLERTLLTGGVLDAVLTSRVAKKRLETPQLDVRYDPPAESGYMRGEY